MTPAAFFEMVFGPVHGKKISSFELHDGSTFVLIDSVCQALAIDYTDQVIDLNLYHWADVEKIQEHTSTGDIETWVIPFSDLPMWLIQIDPTEIRAELRANLERFHAEVATVLAQHPLPDFIRSIFEPAE